MQPFKEKKPTDFVNDTHSSKELMQKELDVNQAEQTLLIHRIRMMNSFLNEIPSFDPQYVTLLQQIHMDQIELDELKYRATILKQKLEVNYGDTQKENS